jgi:transcriptional regulator with GAF, ATPase, and Fis domain
MSADQREIDLARVFVDLADSLRGGHDVIDTMDVLVQATVTHTRASEAAVVLADAGGSLHVVASTSERSVDVEEAQIGTGSGPCVAAYADGHLLEVPDVQQVVDRWPEFVETAEASGLRAAVAIPLTVRDRTIGGMNVFLREAGRLDDVELVLLQAMTHVATISVLQQRDADARDELTDQLQRALDARVTIEQAKGFLAYQHQTGVDQAFALIRDHARRHRVRLREVAEGVVRRELSL